MIDHSLLEPEVQDFINAHVNTPISVLALQKNPFPHLDYKRILQQIESKAKAAQKLPTWFTTPLCLYPSKISIEQTSSEITASYKAQTIHGASLIDLTGGFGVDAYYFAQHFQSVVHCEHDAQLSAMVAHNSSTMGVHNLTLVSGDGLDFLRKSNTRFDWLYLDPSRRHEEKGKVFFLSDCAPNVPELVDEYFEYTDQILIKTAPLLDITAALHELKYVSDVQVIAVQNEVKELLFYLRKNTATPLQITAVTLFKTDNASLFTHEFGLRVPVELAAPQSYLYEPNAALMKSGGYDVLAHQLKLKKLHVHTHLFTATALIDYPGRRFQIRRVFPYQKATMKSLIGKKGHVATRNFPESVAELRKKWKIADGGTSYWFFVTLEKGEKVVLETTKIGD